MVAQSEKRPHNVFLLISNKKVSNMTKQQMLKENLTAIEYLTIANETFWVIQDTMEQYAKQECIALLKYAQYQSTKNPEQLYKMYIESKEK